MSLGLGWVWPDWVRLRRAAWGSGVQLAAECLSKVAKAAAVNPAAKLFLPVKGAVGGDPVAGAAGGFAAVIDGGETSEESVGLVGGMHGSRFGV